MLTKIGLFGSTGRMGQMVAVSALEDSEIFLAGGILGHSRKNQDAKFTCYPLEEAFKLIKEVDVMIDFSTPEALTAHLTAAKKEKKALVIGTTGFSAEAMEEIKKASQEIPILYSANFSLGMALIKIFAKDAAKALSSKKPHIDIIETHHAGKKDAPSGSALSLANAMQPFHSSAIPIHSLRTGKVTGEHTIKFHLDDEMIEITHIAYSRETFAKGALAAAKFLAKQKPGLYSINDILF